MTSTIPPHGGPSVSGASIHSSARDVTRSRVVVGAVAASLAFLVLGGFGILLWGEDGSRLPCPADMGCSPVPPLHLADLMSPDGGFFRSFLYLATAASAGLSASCWVAHRRRTLERTADGRPSGASVGSAITWLVLVAAGISALSVATLAAALVLWQPSIRANGGATEGAAEAVGLLLRGGAGAVVVAVAIALVAGALASASDSSVVAWLVSIGMLPVCGLVWSAIGGSAGDTTRTVLPGFARFDELVFGRPALVVGSVVLVGLASAMALATAVGSGGHRG